MYLYLQKYVLTNVVFGFLLLRNQLLSNRNMKSCLLTMFPDFGNQQISSTQKFLLIIKLPNKDIHNPNSIETSMIATWRNGNHITFDLFKHRRDVSFLSPHYLAQISQISYMYSSCTLQLKSQYNHMSDPTPEGMKNFLSPTVLLPKTYESNKHFVSK